MTHQKKGFITVAALILMIASVSIILAMAYRANQGELSAISLKKSNQSFQGSDNAAEIALRSFRKFDDGNDTFASGAIKSKERIPENTSAKAFCDSISINCYIATGNALISGTATPMSRIASVSNKNVTGTRAIQTNLPQRVERPVADIRTTILAGPDIKLEWGSGTGGTEPIKDPATNGYDKIVIRRTELNASTKDKSPTSWLSDTSLQWDVIATLPLSDVEYTDTDPAIGSGKIFAYTLKVTNKDPLSLDSPYVTPQKIDLP